jgi:hypothetical protein
MSKLAIVAAILPGAASEIGRLLGITFNDTHARLLRRANRHLALGVVLA